MPVPTIPIAIIWIIGAAIAMGAMAGLLAFFMSGGGVLIVLVVLIAFVAVLLIPYLPNRYKWVRDFKRKLRQVLKEEVDNADQIE